MKTSGNKNRMRTGYFSPVAGARCVHSSATAATLSSREMLFMLSHHRPGCKGSSANAENVL